MLAWKGEIQARRLAHKGRWALRFSCISNPARQARQRVTRMNRLTRFFSSHHRSQRLPLRPRSISNDENGGRGEINMFCASGNSI